MQLRSTVFAMLLAAGACAHANGYHAGDVYIEHPYARATVPHQTTGAAYLVIENKGKKDDRLVGLASPIAASVEIHTMSMDGNVMKMREVSEVALKPAAKIAMQPGGGYHLMLIGLRQPLKAGDRFPLTLSFEKAGRAEVLVIVEETVGTGTAHQ